MRVKTNESAEMSASLSVAKDGTRVTRSEGRVHSPNRQEPDCLRVEGAPLGGQHHRLTCVPVEDLVAPTPNAEFSFRPESRPRSTKRERPVLRLLADGETSSVKILLLGMNHRTASIEVRERFAMSDPAVALEKLAATDEIEEAILVSTCNRVELVVATHQPAAAKKRLYHFFEHDLAAGRLPLDMSMDDCTYLVEDGEAVSHVFRVASSIDSMVVGEPQILGQVKDAYRTASDMGVCGPHLARLFQRAFATAKRVKNETRIGQRPVSVPRVAVSLASKIFEGLGDKTALLIGAGGMIELALDSLQREGLTSVRIANRTPSHAQSLAARFGASAHGFDELDDLLVEADVVLSCIGGDRPLLDGDRVARALRSRDTRPIFFIDIGVPRNVDPEVDRLENVYLYDLDDLQDIAANNAEERRRERGRAEQIILEEQQVFEAWLASLRAVPTIRDLRCQAEQIRVDALERVANSKSLGGLQDEQREALDVLTRSIVNKLLHSPLTRLRAVSGHEEGGAMIESARVLFGLNDQDASAGT